MVAESLDDLLEGSDLGCDVLASLSLELDQLLLLLVVSGSLDLPLSLKLGNDVLVLPSDLVRKSANWKENCCQ